MVVFLPFWFQLEKLLRTYSATTLQIFVKVTASSDFNSLKEAGTELVLNVIGSLFNAHLFQFLVLLFVIGVDIYKPRVILVTQVLNC